MDCRSLIIVVVAALVVETLAFPGADDVMYGDSLVDVVQKLLNRVSSLETKVQQLESKSVQVEKDSKIKQSLLPGGYSDFTVQDLMWQSLHMAAAGACRASTELGGSGAWGNIVLPRIVNRTCDDVCNATAYKNCDASLSIMGFVGRRTGIHTAGWFYNYGCSSIAHPPHEADVKVDIARPYSYIGYCCCRH